MSFPSGGRGGEEEEGKGGGKKGRGKKRRGGKGRGERGREGEVRGGEGRGRKKRRRGKDNTKARCKLQPDEQVNLNRSHIHKIHHLIATSLSPYTCKRE